MEILYGNLPSSSEHRWPKLLGNHHSFMKPECTPILLARSLQLPMILRVKVPSFQGELTEKLSRLRNAVNEAHEDVVAEGLLHVLQTHQHAVVQSHMKKTLFPQSLPCFIFQNPVLEGRIRKI